MENQWNNKKRNHKNLINHKNNRNNKNLQPKNKNKNQLLLCQDVNIKCIMENIFFLKTK